VTPRARTRTRRPARGSRQTVDAFGAIADPTRRYLLDMLRAGERSVQELADHFDVTRPAISQHLRILREHDLVEEERVGRQRFYRVHATALREVFEWVQQYESFWDERIVRLRDALREEERREKH
jgi:DNA-binding transcriptional ArsR family regulator